MSLSPGILLITIFLPMAAGLLCLLVPDRVRWGRESIAVATTLAVFVIAILIFIAPELRFQTGEIGLGIRYLDLYSYSFSSFLLMFSSLFGLLISLFSIRYMQGRGRLREYYFYLLLTLGATNGAFLSDNLILFLAFWGIVMVTLFLLTTIGSRDASPERVFDAGHKSLMIIGGADMALLLGIGLLWYLSGTFTMSAITPQSGGMATAAFVLIMLGAISKAGAMPLHSWIPNMAEAAPTSVMAFLPGSLDKLLGIYLLSRMVLNFYEFSPGCPMSLLLMIIGAVTIIAAVMMAMVQHDMRKLLSFHAVSQAGYMVLGIGTGTPIGVAGGIFHMLNNSIFKSGLFLSGGSVEHGTGENDLGKLGGLAKAMPITFIACLICALSISGVPPFNGFFSKWMVYQGILEAGASQFWIFLIAAMFGSALTLASFVKLIHSTFLGQKPRELEGVKESGISMTIPLIVLAALCVVFGVFAQLPITQFIAPVVGPVTVSGVWSPTLATVLLLVALAIGLIIYFIGKIRVTREVPMYIGGETLDPVETSVPGTRFYDTIRFMGVFSGLYRRGEEAVFDIYSYGKYVLPVTRVLSVLHNGRLTTYVSWCLWGLIILFLILVGVG